MQEMDLLGVRVELPANAPMVLLRERSGAGRTVPIFIGAPEATAIALALDGVATPRPMTHDLIRDLLESLAVDLDRVVVSELRDKTFYAELHLVRDGERTVVSCRSSDAIAMAVRTGTPIFASDEVVDEVGYTDEPQGDEPEEVVEEFKDFLDTISPEDFAD
jgi:bifunctional DNase/RNase